MTTDTTKDARHPEQGEDEAFLGNFSQEDFQFVNWKSRRSGDKSRDCRGRLMVGKRPVFVQHEEIEKSHYGASIKMWMQEDGRW